MNELLIKVKISNTSFLVDLENNMFRSLADPDNIVLFQDCRYKDGRWYVSWDRKANTVYNGLRKVTMPSYVSDTAIDFLDNGRQTKCTLLQTIGAVTDGITRILQKMENEGHPRYNDEVCN